MFKVKKSCTTCTWKQCSRTQH